VPRSLHCLVASLGHIDDGGGFRSRLPLLSTSSSVVAAASAPDFLASSSCDEPSATALHRLEALHHRDRITSPTPLASFRLPPLLISEHPRQSRSGRTRGSGGLSLSRVRRSDLTRPRLRISPSTPALHSAGELASQFSLLARAPA
jgi:hypothetical protein